MAPPIFTCTACGDCCRGFGAEAADWEPEAGPVVRLTDEPGLPLLSWEWQRLRALAAARSLALDTQAFDGVVDQAASRVVVLSYRLRARQCPFLVERGDLPPGARSVGWGFGGGGVCSVYEHRPLACRAFPLVPLRNGLALSLHCPEVLDADPGDDASLEEVYGDAARSARAFRAAPQVAVDLLRALEDGGHVALARDAAPLRSAARGWPRVDLCDLAAEAGLGSWEGFEQRARGAAQA